MIKPHLRYSLIAGVLILVPVLSTGCGQGPIAPGSSGGELLEGTRGLDAQGGDPFSLSPDGRWLMFARWTGPDASVGENEDTYARYALERLESYALYDLESGRISRPLVAPEVADFLLQGETIPPGSGCWVADRVILRASGRREIALTPGRSATWRIFDTGLAAAGRNCPFPVRRPVVAGVHGAVRLEMADDGSAVIKASTSGRTLARHAPAWLPGMSVQVAFLAASPDGSRLVYGVTDHFGSFVGNTTAYLLDLGEGRPPLALASPVFAIRWAADGETLYAHVKDDGKDPTAHVVYRWRMPQ